MNEQVRILLLEDNPNDMELAQRELRRGGIALAVKCVETKDDFLRELSAFDPDVVLSDCSMPGFDGFQALEFTRRLRPETPFIFVSGSIGEERAIELMKAGATDYVLKDRLSRLVPCVNRALKERGESSEKKRLAEELVRTREREALILRSMPMALYTSVIGTGHSWVSKHISRVSGFLPDRFLKDPRFWESRIHPEDAERVLKEHASILSKRQIAVEYRWQVLDGSYRWFLDQAVLLPEMHGKAHSMLGTWLDIHERKTLELNFNQAQKMEAVGRLAGGVAHDFNNLLVAIMGYAELILQDTAEDDPKRADLQEIVKAGERAAGLTRQLLAFSRKQVMQVKVMDLNAVVSDISKLMARVIGENVELEIKPGAGLWKIKADPGQLEQVLVNLAVNARDAMSSGGKLTIETANHEIDRAYAVKNPGCMPGPHVMLRVSDTGSGMDAEVQAHLFEPFFTTKGPGKGTGLGLSTIYGIIQQSRGHIEVASTLGQGTTFRIFFPLAEAGSPEPEAAEEPVAGGSGTILLVEDEEGVRRLARRILEKSGYKVLEADNGQAAIAIWDREPAGSICLVISDVVMPLLNGRALKEHVISRAPDAKFIFMSGYSRHLLGHADSTGVEADMINKPFAPADLLKKVREVLGQA